DSLSNIKERLRGEALQWSLGVIAEDSWIVIHVPCLCERASMEPRRDRRGFLWPRDRAGRRHTAPMEPRRDRRGFAKQAPATTSKSPALQWSLGVIAEDSRAAARFAGAGNGGLQWSLG